MKSKFFFSAVSAILLSTSLTACSTNTTNSIETSSDNSITPVIQDEISSQIDYPTTPQETDEWRFRYDEKAGGIIIEKCLCANKHSDDIIKSKDSDIVIPSAFEGFEGLNVVGIGPNAFENMVMKSLTIPDTVVSLGKQAFKSAEVTETLTIPASVTEIGEECFSHYWEGEVVLPPVEAVGSYMFNYSDVKKVVISEGTTVITNFAFNMCDSLEELVIPNSVEEITKTGLGGDNIYSQTTVILPENLKVCDVDYVTNHYIVFKGETYDFPAARLKGDWNEFDELKEKLQQAINSNV